MPVKRQDEESQTVILTSMRNAVSECRIVIIGRHREAYHRLKAEEGVGVEGKATKVRKAIFLGP